MSSESAFTTNPFCSPQSIVPRHLLNQGDGLLGDPWCGRSSPRLVLPKAFAAQAMPPQHRLWLNEEQRLFPCPHHACQQDQEHPVGSGTGDETVVERLKTKACQPLHEGENPMHNVHSPFVKMCESMLAIVLFLCGIHKEQE